MSNFGSLEKHDIHQHQTPERYHDTHAGQSPQHRPRQTGYCGCVRRFPRGRRHTNTNKRTIMSNATTNEAKAGDTRGVNAEMIEHPTRRLGNTCYDCTTRPSNPTSNHHQTDGTRRLKSHTQAGAAAWKHRNSRQCTRTGVQNKETLTAPWSAAWPWEWWQQKREDAWPRGKRRAASSAPALTIQQRNSVCKQTMQPGCRSQSTSSFAAQKSSPVPTTGSMRCRKSEAWRINGTWTTVTSCATQFWCCLFSAGFRRRQRQGRSGTEPTENRSHLLRERSGCGATRVEDPRRAEHGENLCRLPTVASHSESLLDLSSSSRTSSWARQTSSERCTNVFNSARTRRRSSPSSERVWESALSTISGGFPATKSCRNRGAAEVHDEVGQRSLERLFPGLTEDSMTQATLSAGQSGIGFKGARDVAAPAHLKALIAAKPRMQEMIQDAVWAGLLPQQILEARLSEVIETATSTCLSALDNDEQATAKLHVQSSGRSLAANNWRKAGARRYKPDRRVPRTRREQILETRLSEVIETASSTYLSALVNNEQKTARLYVQKAAQAEDESWQQTVSGQQGPGVTNPTIASLEHPAPPPKTKTAMTWTSQRPEEPTQCAAAPSAAFTTH